MKNFYMGRHPVDLIVPNLDMSGKSRWRPMGDLASSLLSDVGTAASTTVNQGESNLLSSVTSTTLQSQQAKTAEANQIGQQLMNFWNQPYGPYVVLGGGAFVAFLMMRGAFK